MYPFASRDPLGDARANLVEAEMITEVKPKEVEYPGGFSSELTTDQKIDAIYVQMQVILSFVENINNQVAPVMDKIKNSPIGAMLGM